MIEITENLVIAEFSLDLIYRFIGFLVFWSVVIVVTSVLGLFVMLKAYTTWRYFWINLSDKQWEDNTDNGEYPSMSEIKKSWIFLQLAHPIKYGVLEDSKEHKEEWKQKIESQKE